MPASGDTATINHNVTVDVDSAVGTSPNDTTTIVLTIAGGKILTISSGVTLTVKGNITWANASKLTLNSGHLLFDNSASGGTPTYGFNSANLYLLEANGTLGNPCSISCAAGSLWQPSTVWTSFVATYTTFQRVKASSLAFVDVTLSHCTFDECQLLTLTSTQTTKTYLLDDNRWTNTSGVGGSLNLNFSGVFTSGSRFFRRNILDKFFTYNSKGFTLLHNCFLGGVAMVAGVTWTFRLNYVSGDGTLGGGNGQPLVASTERNYYVVNNGVGNPHFLGPTAKAGVDNIISQSIFESQTPDLVDYGDAILLVASCCTAGLKVVGKNNIVLRSGYSGATCSSGTLLTMYNADANVLGEWYHNTANNDNATSGLLPKRSPFATAESGNGTAGQVAALKSNLVWGSAAGQGYLAERLGGTVQDIITASGADYNWRFNGSAGDNQRGYEDQAGSGNLWAAGDAVAAGVDAHGGSGDPQFFDSARNMAKWCFDRGYGVQTFAAAETALQADPTRIPDLINYVFEGFRPGNVACRNAAHDGGCVGCANYYKATRTVGTVSDHRAQLSKFGL